MKINQVLEGYVKRYLLDREEDERLGIKKAPLTPQPPKDTNKLYYLELWYDSSGYFVKTVAPTLKKAESNALFKVKKYLKTNYPKYDITGLRKDQVLIDEIPADQIKIKQMKLIDLT